MTVARIYIIPAADGRSAEMEEALIELSKVVAKADGSKGVELLRDLGRPAALMACRLQQAARRMGHITTISSPEPFDGNGPSPLRR